MTKFDDYLNIHREGMVTQDEFVGLLKEYAWEPGVNTHLLVGLVVDKTITIEEFQSVLDVIGLSRGPDD